MKGKKHGIIFWGRLKDNFQELILFLVIWFPGIYPGFHAWQKVFTHLIILSIFMCT